jgi:DNA recombination protein RmuC
LCRDSVITLLLGGRPGEVPGRYADASAIRRLPLGVAQVLVIGEHEEFVPRPVAEAYVRAAQEAGDPARAEAAARALEARVRLEAASVAEKYLEPPATTDFALLYLPFEGLYAEVLRRPGLFEQLQRESRVTLCGPATLSAVLNSLQMGFRTLAIEKRSSEVWQLLGEVKGEFGRFGEVLARAKAQLQTVANSMDQAEVRTRQIERRLKDVEVTAVLKEPSEPA